MRKIASILLSVLLISSLAACGNQNSANTENPVSSGANKIEVAEDSPTVQTSDNSSLVVFYSATGSTKAVAETIAQTLDADIFEITPEEPYTDEDLNWNNADSRVSIEHNDESKREIPLTDTMPNDWETYDTVYIGYPIWWGIAAWPVDNFVKANDFTGKTVVPFCTAASSGIGDSGNLLEKMAGTGDWKEGERFRGGASKSDVTEWVDSLEL